MQHACTSTTCHLVRMTVQRSPSNARVTSSLHDRELAMAYSHQSQSDPHAALRAEISVNMIDQSAPLPTHVGGWPRHMAVPTANKEPYAFGPPTSPELLFAARLERGRKVSHFELRNACVSCDIEATGRRMDGCIDRY